MLIFLQYCCLRFITKKWKWNGRYSYQIPQGEPNHTCGSADIWSGVVNNSDIFCSPGSYCPTTTRKVSCDSGYWFIPYLLLLLYKLSQFLLLQDSVLQNYIITYYYFSYPSQPTSYWFWTFYSLFLSNFRYYCRMGSTHQNRKALCVCVCMDVCVYTASIIYLVNVWHHYVLNLCFMNL